MSQVLKKTGPYILTIILILSLFLTFFFDVGGEYYEKTVLGFAVVIATASLGLGIINLLIIHIRRIAENKEGNWFFSAVLVGSMLLMIIVGLIFGGESDEFSYLYDATITPLGGTLHSLFIVWLAPAMFRAFRIKDIKSGLLIVALVLVIFGGSILGTTFWPGSAAYQSWLGGVPGMAQQRAIKITIGLGLIITAIRILTNRERTMIQMEVSE